MNSTSEISDKQLVSTMQLKTIMPNGPSSMLSKFLDEFNKQLPIYNIDTPLRIAAFIAQGALESGELRELVENLNYSAVRIHQVWPKRFPSAELAQPYQHNPEKLGNNVYANRMGNGSPESGDGYKFRGRGWFNGTGKGFYKKMTQLTGTNFITNPDLLATPVYAVKSACLEWKAGNMNQLADVKDIKAITKKINGGYNGLAERMNYYNKAKKTFGLTQ